MQRFDKHAVIEGPKWILGGVVYVVDMPFSSFGCQRQSWRD